VTIGTECPHCESVFQVGADLVGKAMRCPNPTCREVFTVEPAAAALPPVTATPDPTGSVADFLPVYEAERVNTPTVTYEAIPTPPVPVVEGEPVAGEVYVAEVIEVTPAAPVQKATPLPPAPRRCSTGPWWATSHHRANRAARRPAATTTRTSPSAPVAAATRSPCSS
jgi:hypothetical protein